VLKEINLVTVFFQRSFSVYGLWSVATQLNHNDYFVSMSKILEFASSAFAAAVAPVKSLLGRRSRAATALSDVSSTTAPELRDTRSSKRLRVDEIPSVANQEDHDVDMGVDDDVVVPPVPVQEKVSIYKRILDGFKKNFKDHQYLWAVGLCAVSFGFNHFNIHHHVFYSAINNGFSYNTAAVMTRASQFAVAGSCILLAYIGGNHIAESAKVASQQ
jgi:hypothetical protein